MDVNLSSFHSGAFSLALGESDSKRKAILKTVAHQSCYFSLFLVNFIHLVSEHLSYVDAAVVLLY